MGTFRSAARGKKNFPYFNDSVVVEVFFYAKRPETTEFTSISVSGLMLWLKILVLLTAVIICRYQQQPD